VRIDYVTGDLLEAPEPVFIHGCNAQGVQQSGIAGLIRAKWPEVYTGYRAYYGEHRQHGGLLGRIAWVTVETDTGPRRIGNAITRECYGRDGIRYCSYDAIARVMAGLNAYADEMQVDRIAMPLIGAGLAGGSWRVISTIIESEARAYRPVVYLLDGLMPSS
jgi:O-acetyl-ADP-ribose deacetylase (regulator of RNase III)